MKKGMFFALAASSLLFGACSSDDAVVNTTAQNEAVQQIVLQVASSGDGLTTRAGRPLYSSQALQTIQNVRVIIYKNETGGGEKTIVYDKKLDWTSSAIYNTNGHGRQITLSLKGNERLSEGNYKVMAVGYSNDSKYSYSLNVKDQAALTNQTYSPITATLGANADAEEVFAGDADLTINANQQITPLISGEENRLAVTLHRQVAGSFGYFQNIPAKVGGKTGAALTPNAHFNNDNGDNGYVLYSIDLNTWFPQGDENNDGLLNAEDRSWKRPDDVKTQVVTGSVFGSNFVIPFKYTDGKNTMELQLLDADNKIIKTWTVSIPQSDVNNDGNKGLTDASNSIFNVVRNHMYNLGVKTSNGTKTDPDPSNPNPDPKPDPKPNPEPGTDQPEDLNKFQHLILKVNDNWEVIHNMELGE